MGGARFENLRAVGAFLVSAAYDGNAVTFVTILSEKGSSVRLANPRGKAHVHVTRLKDNQRIAAREEGKIVLFPTEPGQRYPIEQA